MKRIALCVGIDGYSNGIVPLSCAKNDAGRVYQQLLAEFDEVKYLHDFNASQNNIISETSAIAKRLEPGDIFLFYFSGHGMEMAGSHLLLSSAAQAALLNTGFGTVNMSALNTLTAKPGVHRLFILDCCRNELFTGAKGSNVCRKSRGVAMEKLIRESTGKSVIQPLILNSCAAGECSWEDERRQQGYFTGALLEAVADRTVNNFKVFADKLQAYLHNMPTPQKQSVCWNGNLSEWNDVVLFKSWSAKPVPPPVSNPEVNPVAANDKTQTKRNWGVYGMLLLLLGALILAAVMFGMLLRKGGSEKPAVDRPVAEDVKGLEQWQWLLAPPEPDKPSQTVEADYRNGYKLYKEKNYIEAMVMFKVAAEQKYPAAYYCLGEMYNNGYGVAQDFAEAAKYYSEAVVLHHTLAKVRLGKLYLYGRGVEQNQKLAFALFKQAYKAGDRTACYYLGLCYESGWGVEQDSGKAFENYLICVQSGVEKEIEGACSYKLAVFFEKGIGINPNAEKAREHILKAVNLNNIDALKLMGSYHENGTGGFQKDLEKALEYYRNAASSKCSNCSDGKLKDPVCPVCSGSGRIIKPSADVERLEAAIAAGRPKSDYQRGEELFQRKEYARAIEYFNKAANTGDAKSYYQLANCLENGLGVEVDMERAINFYQRSAALGHEKASQRLNEIAGEQYVLGRKYYDEKNYEKAVICFRRSADLGNVRSQNNFGVCLSNGYGIEKNPEKAFSYFKQAAEKGLMQGQYNLADCYEAGHGVKRDLNLAMHWYQQAADNGSEDARKKFEELKAEKKQQEQTPFQQGMQYWRKQDWNNAFKCLKPAAEAGDINAQAYLSVCYDVGLGVEKNSELMIYWASKSALSGNALAQSMLGDAYRLGNGVRQDAQQAFYWYKKAAGQGNLTATHNLGWCYENGFGVKADEKQALEWYRRSVELGNDDSQKEVNRLTVSANDLNAQGDKFFAAENYTEALKFYRQAAEAGHAGAQNSMGWCYQKGYGVKQDSAEAFRWYKKGAENGDSTAQGNVGWCYENGYGVKQDYAEAYKWYKKGAEAGNTLSISQLGWLYQKGYGVKQDYAEAFKWHKKGAEAGEPAAMGHMGWYYENGYGVKQDYAEAYKWYKKGAEAGNVFSMSQLGWLYQNGYGVKQDYAEAYKWYKKGAEAGNAFSMSQLGWLYQNGYGVKQDYAEAFKWHKKGAEAGDSGAMSNMGWYYENGYGVKQDYAEAYKWYKKGAEAGNVTSMSNVGWCYENGLGVTKDYAEALKWYRKAEARGYKEAAEHIKRVEKLLNK